MTKLKMPAGMRARKRGNKTHYYLDNNVRSNRKLTPLGNNFAEALIKYAEHMTVDKKTKTYLLLMWL
jgi:hypothetical protein